MKHGYAGIIHTARTNAGLGLREAARLIGISPAYMSMLETKDNVIPSADKLHDLIECLEMSEEESRLLILEYIEHQSGWLIEMLDESPH